MLLAVTQQGCFHVAFGSPFNSMSLYGTDNIGYVDRRLPWYCHHWGCLLRGLFLGGCLLRGFCLRGRFLRWGILRGPQVVFVQVETSHNPVTNKWYFVALRRTHRGESFCLFVCLSLFGVVFITAPKLHLGMGEVCPMLLCFAFFARGVAVLFFLRWMVAIICDDCSRKGEVTTDGFLTFVFCEGGLLLARFFSAISNYPPWQFVLWRWALIFSLHFLFVTYLRHVDYILWLFDNK